MIIKEFLEQSRAYLSSLPDVNKVNLEAIERAEQKERAGTYGRCDRCGGDIDYLTLLTYKHATVCRSCGIPNALFPWGSELFNAENRKEISNGN